MNSALRQSHPLVAHRSPDSVISYREGQAITVRQFLVDVARIGTVLGAGRHVLNLCSDRYRFMVVLAACVAAGKISLLPSSHTPETFRTLANFAPDVFCLADGCVTGIELAQIAYPEEAVGGSQFESAAMEVPLIDGGQTVAYVFTSGSTGMSVPHKKTWGLLVKNVLAEAGRLGAGECYTLVGTVPPQHMYGFE